MMIEVNKVVKRYKELIALDHFDFHVEEGEIVGLLGPNGSGKTTLINCMLSLLKFDKGEIKIFGKPLAPDDWESKSRIGIVPQELAYFEKLTVKENIDYFCGLYKKDKKERQRLTKETIAFTGLDGYEGFLPRKLSGGLKRRLNIACGISHRPELLFLDEPTVAVDAQSRNFILEGVERMNQDGSTVVYTTHYLEEAEKICTRIVIIDKGRNLVSGTKEELIGMIGTHEIIHIRLLQNPGGIAEAFRELPHILEVTEDPGEGEFVLKFEKGGDNLYELMQLIRARALSYSELYCERPSLNDVFLELTGKELRD